MRKNPLFRYLGDWVSVWLGAALLLVVLAPLTLRGQTGYGTILGRMANQRDHHDSRRSSFFAEFRQQSAELAQQLCRQGWQSSCE